MHVVHMLRSEHYLHAASWPLTGEIVIGHDLATPILRTLLVSMMACGRLMPSRLPGQAKTAPFESALAGSHPRGNI